MKKIIFIIFLVMTFQTKAQDQNNWNCIQDNNNFIVLYPLLGKWAVITDKPIKAAKRATGITTGSAIQVTAAVVNSAPEGTKKRIWTQGAIENGLAAYIEPICYY